MTVEIPDYEILSAPDPKPRNTRYTGRASKLCAVRGGHDWGRVPVLRMGDPRGVRGLRPGDICATCGRKRISKIDWDQEQPIYGIPLIPPRKFQDRSRYDARGRKNKGAYRG